VVVLPGTKSTIDDLEFLHSSGLEIYLRALRARSIPIVGICGGFQMLGTHIFDLDRVEGSTTATEGLGLLDVVTKFERRKQTVRVEGISLVSGERVAGYEIHMGQPERAPNSRPLFRILSEQGHSVDRFDGCVSDDGLVWGTYVHGLFDAPGFRREFLNQLRVRRGWEPLSSESVSSKEVALDSLANLVTLHLDCAMLRNILAGRI
jgi:adenosylcobyric acid synthase